MLTFFHVADLHCSKARARGCLKVLETLAQDAERGCDGIFVSGDFWDGIMTNTVAFADYISAMKKIIKKTAVYMIYGTPSHETAGSLEVFKALGAHVYDTPTFSDVGKFEIVAIPEPRKVDYLPYKKSKQSIEDCINDRMKTFLESIPEKNNKPRIVMYHGEIAGCSYENGVACSSKIAIKPDQLKAINADYIACGHIHAPIKVPGVENCYYCGSMPPKNYGESLDSGYNKIVID